MTTDAPGSWTPALTRRVIEAFVNGRYDALEAILADLGERGPVRDAVTGLREFLLANHGRLPWSGLGPHLDAALAEPPQSSDVLACLLNAACVRARELDRDPERRRLVARMREVLPRLRLPRTRALVHRQAWMIAMEDDDVPAALAEVAALDPGDDHDLHLEFQCRAVEARLADHDVAGVRPLIDHLVDCGNPFIDAWHLRARLDLVTGDVAAIIARIQADRHLPPNRARYRPTHLVAEAAALAGREDLVESLVAEWLRMLPAGPAARRQERFLESVRLFTRIGQVIRRREPDRARDLMQTCGPLAMPHPDGRRYLLRASLRLDLSTGALASARDALASLDPHGRRGDLQVEWARLLRAEGDLAGAAARIAAVLARGAGATLAPALAWAHELDAAATARLLLAAREPSVPVAAPVVRPAPSPERLVGDSPGMRTVRAAIDAVAPLDQAVLILGETGTGKEVAAGLIHAGGRRGAAPLVALNCAAIPESLAESELFGHLRGSFTGAEQDREGILSAAGDGDIFLDEIDSLSLRLQGLLLRVLETGDYRAVGDTAVRRFRARFITAANGDLGALITEGRFRRDLYYRLQRFVVTIPPLRDRREDIPALAGYLIDRVAGDRRLSLDPRLVDLLVRHDWPGNVRELRNVVERMALLCGDRLILGPADCPELAPGWGRAAAVPPPAPPPVPSTVPIPGQPRTRDRRARILAMFATHTRLHRQDVVRELRTAATTATEDLRVLCALGLIRRVDTSGHACTSYFVRAAD